MMVTNTHKKCWLVYVRLILVVRFLGINLYLCYEFDMPLRILNSYLDISYYAENVLIE